MRLAVATLSGRESVAFSIAMPSGASLTSVTAIVNAFSVERPRESVARTRIVREGCVSWSKGALVRNSPATISKEALWASPAPDTRA